MGQNGSHHHERSSKHRQSTRSLPDAALNRLENDQAQWAAYANSTTTNHYHHHNRKLRENSGVCTVKTNTGGASAGSAEYDQNLENFQKHWNKAAAPYYAPSNGKRFNAGPRSYDGNYYRGASTGVESARSERKFVTQNEELDDNWSDVASDMYRIKKHASYRSSIPTSKYRDRDAKDFSDAKEDCPAPSKKHHKSRRYKRGTSESGAVLSRVPENPMDTSGQFNYPNADHSHAVDVYKGRRSKSVQSFRAYDNKGNVVVDQQMMHQKIQHPSGDTTKPPRPPKKLHYYARLENPAEEKWVDYPVRNSKVKFESAATSSPSSEFSSPKTPTSSECEKLIIQSLRAELSAERSHRVDIENKAKKESKECEYLRRTVESLEIQVGRLTKSLLDKNESKLEEKKAIAELQETVKQLEEDKVRLEKDNQQQKCAYNRCLDDIADKVTHAVINQKALQTECDRLKKYVLDLERKNKTLQNQLDAKPHSIYPEITTAQTSKIVPVNKWTSVKSEPPVFRFSSAAVASCESITSFNDSNLIVSQPHFPTTSPISNGGEGMCSRPTSFNFDMYSNTELMNGSAVILQQSQSSESLSDSEMPKNFAEIYGEIDDPYQQKSTPLRHYAGTTEYAQPPLVHHNGGGTAPRQPLPVIIAPPSIQNPLSPARSRKSADAAGSNDTLCQGDQTPKQTSPKREIVVNMVHSLHTDFSQVFQSHLFTLDKTCFPPLICDDGYSTMSSSALWKLMQSKCWQTQPKPLGLSKSDTTLVATNGQRTLDISQKQLSKSDSMLNVKNKHSKNNSSTKEKIFASQEEIYNNFQGLLSSRNELTEFERDMLLWQHDGEVKREALFELEDDDLQLMLSSEQEIPKPLAVTTEIDQQHTACQLNETSITTAQVANAASTNVPSFKIKETKKILPVNNRKELNDSSTTSSYTSDDSEDDGSAMVDEWLKQLKIKKAKGKQPVVRYSPTVLRPSVLRRNVYLRFGKQERKALTCFDFLYRQPSSRSPVNNTPPQQQVLRKDNKFGVAQRRLLMLDKRKSGSFSNLMQPTFSTNDDYENLPYHRLVRTLSADLGDKKSIVSYHWRHCASSTSSSLEWSSSRRSFGSSLFLSDLALADRTLSSSSSLSFTNF